MCISILSFSSLCTGLYFSTLAGLVVICFVAGLINIPNIIYFAGKEYSNSQPGLPFLMKGSAVCTQERVRSFS